MVNEHAFLVAVVEDADEIIQTIQASIFVNWQVASVRNQVKAVEYIAERS